MDKGTLLRVISCLVVFAIYLYGAIQKQNKVNYLSLQVPREIRDLKAIEEENIKLRFQIESFQSPDHLIRIVKQHGYAHLKYPLREQVFGMPEGNALCVGSVDKDLSTQSFMLRPALAVGVNH